MRGLSSQELTPSQSCITEEQKYQGALYKEKASKVGKRKSVSIADPKSSKAVVPRAAYVEEASDVDIPPPAPSPPPAASPRPVEPVNVFDFLVPEKSPNASRVSLGGSREQMCMKMGAQSIFSSSRNNTEATQPTLTTGEEQVHDDGYEADGYAYGAEPVKPIPNLNQNDSMTSLDFMTPAAKITRARIERKDSADHSRTNSGATSDKKRKRGSPEALDLSAINAKGTRRHQPQNDTTMAEAPPSSADPPSLTHSGLTGGLNRLLTDSRDPFPPTPDYSDEKEYAQEMNRKNRHSRAGQLASPLKRSRHSKDDASNVNSGPGISMKGRAGRIMSMVGGASTGGAFSVLNPAGLQNKENASAKTKRRDSMSEDGHHGNREVKKFEIKKYHVPRPTSILPETRTHSPVHSRSHGERQANNASNASRRRRGSDESPDPRRRKVKAIEYHPSRQKDRQRAAESDSGSDDDSNAHHHRHGSVSRNRGRGGGEREMVVFGEEERLKMRAEAFLSYVNKGPDSEKGCSINKVLKRWHRDGAGAEEKHGGNKEDEQKELWRGLRLRKNDRGEVVVFF